ncbi:MFS transporter [Nitrincola tapanii]|uniref:MFS transporter n=1 Tax=Nitrincola tapanii TaxID=1708751 RepID=A0A5A9W140_9GAMM|nr:MFS transporter [Nitrincola tapanii]KAA0874446.1 MFS transporter [Nitrincola tapanii]
MSCCTRPTASWLIIFLPFALGYYLSYLLRTVNAVISPDLTSELGLSAADLGLLTSVYFLTFGLAQIPLGIALDRYGPKRVLGSLLLLAGIGSIAFALGDTRQHLTLARGLIGLGVSACLMASLKGFALWYPPERQSSMTGFIMAAGALGALTASTPMEALLPHLGWRGVFGLIAGLSFALSITVFITLPGDAEHRSHDTLKQTLRSIGTIFCSPTFLRFAGSATFFTGGFMALQSLWAVPWLMQVNGLSLNQAAYYLMTLNLGMLLGQLSIGFFGTRLSQGGVTPLNLMQFGYAAMLGVQLLILIQIGPTLLLWFLLGILSAANAQTYIATAVHFPKSAFGRVSTAINLMAFAGAFIVQWGLGIALDTLQSMEYSMSLALKIAFAGLMLIQALCLVPLWVRSAQAKQQ